MTRAERVAVAMSGGVDSAVAASLLVEQGVEVFGVMLRLWVEDGRVNRCCSPDDVAAARRTAGLLGIPFFVLDMQETFRQEVVSFFLDGYAQGVTPNPCIECNRRIRWTHLLGEALALGATHLATGHYARVVPRNGRLALLQARHAAKDQSYVLSVLGQDQLARARFPLGEMTKADVRAHARHRGLPVAERPESQDLCFLAGQDYRDFLRRHAARPLRAGPIVDHAGRHLGEHSGLGGYTIGQRRGLGIASNQALYVLAKDVASHTLVVGTRSELGRSEFHARRVSWVAGSPPAAAFEAEVQVRYRARQVGCRVTPADDDTARVELALPLSDVTPGQAAVFYAGEECLGGGTISA